MRNVTPESVVRAAKSHKAAVIRWSFADGGQNEIKIPRGVSIAQLRKLLGDGWDVDDDVTVHLMDHDGLPLQIMGGEIFTGEYAIMEIMLRAQKMTLAQHTYMLKPHLKAIEVATAAQSGTITALAADNAGLRAQITELRAENKELRKAVSEEGDELAIIDKLTNLADKIGMKKK